MRSLKAGAVLLSIWSGLNLLVAAAVTLMVLLGRTPPALLFLIPEAEARQLDIRAVAVINAQAVLANPLIVAFCVLVLAVVWRGLVERARWALGALAGATLPLQGFGFVSDVYLGNKNLVANCVSTALLVAGLALAGRGLRAAPRPAP